MLTIYIYTFFSLKIVWSSTQVISIYNLQVCPHNPQEWGTSLRIELEHISFHLHDTCLMPFELLEVIIFGENGFLNNIMKVFWDL
jgi:hypothetical protein